MGTTSVLAPRRSGSYIIAAGRTPRILVNNAAANPYYGPAIDMDLGAYEKTVEVNLRGYFWSTVQAARRMKAAGGGSIINIASVNARRPAFGQLVYSMTKAGIVNMTEGFAKELAPLGVRVNAVLPGLTDTKFASALTGNPKILEMMLRLIPLARVAQPDEIAPAVRFLASPASSYLTGAALPVDMTFTLFGDRLEVEVVDTGPGFDPEALNGDVTSPEHLFDARGRGDGHVGGQRVG